MKKKGVQNLAITWLQCFLLKQTSRVAPWSRVRVPIVVLRLLENARSVIFVKITNLFEIN